jgi:hypothetical protein
MSMNPTRSPRSRARRWARFAALLAGALAASCAYRPSRFRDRPPITHARDMSPIPMPAFRWVAESVYLSQVYLFRPIRGTLDLDPIPPAGDVNSMDEVPYCSWFVPRDVDVGTMARGPDAPGPPRPPFAVLSETPRAIASSGFVIADARGQRYEMLFDPPDRLEMRTGAAAIASRLVWALGLNTPAVDIVQVRPEQFWRSEPGAPDVGNMLGAGPPGMLGAYRMASLAMPPSVWLGNTDESGTRSDDANDVIAHEDRRVLRSLKVFASWMALSGIGPSKTMDRYLGVPGEGHVMHFLTGLDDALGAADVVRVTDLPPGEGGGSPLMRLITLGLAPNPARRPTQIELPAVGQFEPEVDPRTFNPSTPYAPAERLTAADGYWAAKRIAVLSAAHIALAIEAGKIGDRRARKVLQDVLEARRERVIRHWFDRVTPLELTKLEGVRLTLRDQAIHYHLARADITDYYVDFLTSEGAGVGDRLVLRTHAGGDELEIVLPEAAMAAARDYLVVRIIVRRDLRRAPRAFVVHLRLGGGQPNVVGVRH